MTQILEARGRAHRYFDELWISRRMSRCHAYKWMKKTLKLKSSEAHIAKLSLVQCEQLITAVQRLRKQRPA